MKARSINQKFLTSLKWRFETTPFTTKNAEDVYFVLHRTKPSGFEKRGENDRSSDRYWGDMSARNTLTAAVQHGKLVRLRKGWYRFED